MKYKNIHFVGISGIGMSGLARIFTQMGAKVTGSDLKINDIALKLIDNGALIHQGHSRENLPRNAEIVVYSSAISKDNPEIQKALEMNIPVVQRAFLLDILMKDRYSIAVTGTHGKTTTSSMLGMALLKGGYDPTIVVGGQFSSFDLNARLGRGKYLVAEADESDASFLQLTPSAAIITNIDTDINLNCDYFKNCGFESKKVLDRVVGSFKEFINKVPDNEIIMACADCDNLQVLIKKNGRKFYTYAIDNKADFTARDIRYIDLGSVSKIYHKEKYIGDLELSIPGKYNILNCLAAISVSMLLGIDFNNTANVFKEYRGPKRRFQILGEKNGILVVDDYAHNPTKIKSVLNGAKMSSRRVIAVFQPHRYSRTKFMFDEYSHSFKSADTVIVTDVYSADEKPIEDINSVKIAELIKKNSNCDEVIYIPDSSCIVDYLIKKCRKNDLVITLGAGDVNLIGEKLLNSLMSVAA